MELLGSAPNAESAFVRAYTAAWLIAEGLENIRLTRKLIQRFLEASR